MDLEYAVRQFEDYLNHYDREDDKVRLKIVHTYGVMDCSRRIAEGMNLDREDILLARLIGLLHDIGRFEQLKRFDSFEPGTMDHASFGVELLFGEGWIRRFVKEDTWDPIIREAIARHSDFCLEGIEDERTLLHARLIRDADKLDNCRVKLEDPVETFMDLPAVEVGRQKITEAVMEQFRRKESILSANRQTKMDYWVSYMAYFFDINFRETFAIIRKEDYVTRMIARIPYSDPETAARMEEIEETLNQYIGEQLAGKRRIPV